MKKRKPLTLFVVCLSFFVGLLLAALPTGAVRAQVPCFGYGGNRRYNAAMAASQRGDYAEALKSLAKYIECDMHKSGADADQIKRTYEFLVKLTEKNAERTARVDVFASKLVSAGKSVNQMCPNEKVSNLLEECETGTDSGDSFDQSCPGVLGQESALSGFDDSTWRLFELTPTPSPFWPDRLPMPTPTPMWMPSDRFLPADSEVKFPYNIYTR